MAEEQYVSEGVKLLESPIGNGIEGYMDGLGNIVRYNRKETGWLLGMMVDYLPFTLHMKGINFI